MTAVVWFTRDLRIHDNPALHHAVQNHEHVVPVFVFDDAVAASPLNRPNSTSFLLDSLRDLDKGLRTIGAALVVRRGSMPGEIVRLARETNAETVYASADATAHAQRRIEVLAAELGAENRVLRLFDALTVVQPGSCLPAGKDHAAVFTPYWRKWEKVDKRAVLPAPSRLRLPEGIDCGLLPSREEICPGDVAPRLALGGETRGRQLVKCWLAGDVERYDEDHDSLADDGTSRLSPYLHFGCVSPTEIVARADLECSGVVGFTRQLAWRDFYHQLLSARPACERADYRSQGDRWDHDPQVLAAWKEGRTGYPIVDAGMRQLLAEGWMHNRARLITASFLTKDLYQDWRVGAQYFFDHLVDADVANNQMNWQWVAGTGTDSRPNRVFNPLRQAERYDPNGDYVRQYLPELSDIEGRKVHQPWNLPDDVRAGLDYPQQLVEHAEAVEYFRRARGKD